MCQSITFLSRVAIFQAIMILHSIRNNSRFLHTIVIIRLSAGELIENDVQRVFEDVSTNGDVGNDVRLLFGRDRRRICERFDGSRRRLVSHALRRVGALHRLLLYESKLLAYLWVTKL